MVDQQTIYASAEEDILASKPSTVPYIAVGKNIPEYSFRSFEVANASYVSRPKMNQSVEASLSKAARMVAEVMIKNRQKPGRVLGLHA